jgi:hypothetical protein
MPEPADPCPDRNPIGSAIREIALIYFFAFGAWASYTGSGFFVQGERMK